MEREHRDAGDEMQTIRQLTNGYVAPADGCTTYRVCMAELARFERDLHEQQPTQYLHEALPIQQPTDDGYTSALRVVLETTIEDEAEQFGAPADFIRVTDEH